MPVVTIGENTSDDFSGCVDVSCWDTSNHDGDQVLPVAPWPGVAFLRFTGLSNIAASSTVNSATCYLQPDAGYPGSGSPTIDVHRILRAWVVDEVTSTIYSTGNSWTSTCGTSDGNDRTASVRVTYSPSTSSVYQGFTSANFNADIEDFIDGTLTNDGHGLYVSSSERWFDSSEAADGDRPYLSVDYTAGAAGAIINQFQKNNLGSDLFNGTIQ